MNAPLEMRHVTVTRGGREVLSDINLTVTPREFVAIVGKSGGGKSTLLHALAGHLPYEGEIMTPRDVGMVFQRFAVFPWLTAEQNVTFGLTMGKAANAAWARECLRLAGLEDKARSYPSSLSGGQQQRIAVARAIAHEPDVLLMDEPFGSLDALTRESMQAWLSDVRREHEITTLLVTHSIEEALLTDRVVVLRDGRVSADLAMTGDKDDLRRAIRAAL